MLTNNELRHLLNVELRMNCAQKIVLLTALNARVCGVVRQSTIRQSTNLCLQRGQMQHGWRCGNHGHVNNVYFEGKAQANPSALRTVQQSRLRSTVQSGVHVDLIPQPDFSIIGRQSVNLHPRIWRTPQRNTFVVRVIGFEFRVHPSDPRAGPQIEAAVAWWNLHAAVIQQVVWQMLQLYGVQRASQPLKLQPYEMGQADVPQQYSSAFTSIIPPISEAKKVGSKQHEILQSVWHQTPKTQRQSLMRDENQQSNIRAKTILNDSGQPTIQTTQKLHTHISTKNNTQNSLHDKSVLSTQALTPQCQQNTVNSHQPQYTVVQHRMLGPNGEQKPWFSTPLPQRFDNGIPVILPFAPSLIIHSSFRQIRRELITENVTSQLLQPVLDMTCLVHPRSCFWWNTQDQQKCVRQILDYAKRVPFALPFNLYLRIDTTQSLRDNPQLQVQMNEYYKTKAKYFDLRQFRLCYRSYSSQYDKTQQQTFKAIQRHVTRLR